MNSACPSRLPALNSRTNEHSISTMKTKEGISNFDPLKINCTFKLFYQVLYKLKEACTKSLQSLDFSKMLSEAESILDVPITHKELGKAIK